MFPPHICLDLPTEIPSFVERLPSQPLSQPNGKSRREKPFRGQSRARAYPKGETRRESRGRLSGNEGIGIFRPRKKRNRIWGCRARISSSTIPRHGKWILSLLNCWHGDARRTRNGEKVPKLTIRLKWRQFKARFRSMVLEFPLRCVSKILAFSRSLGVSILNSLELTQIEANYIGFLFRFSSVW